MRKHFCKHKCRLCGRMISIAGFAQWHHQKKHEREGLYNSGGGLTDAGRKMMTEQEKKCPQK